MRREGTNAARLAAGKFVLQAQLFPESETKFFLKVVDAQISFVKDATGSVTGLILYNPGGKNIPGTRVK